MQKMQRRYQQVAGVQAHSNACISAPLRLRVAASRDVRARGVGDFFKNIMDFDSWAPKSTKIWRLQQYEYQGQQPETEQEQKDAEAIESLSERVNEMRRATFSEREAQEEEELQRKTFTEANDSELSSALSRRITQVSGSYDGSVDEPEQTPPLEADEMRELIYTKYGKTHDVSFVRRDLPGKSFVALNIMWTHLEQRSFKMTEEQYMEKLDAVATMVNVLGQTDKVRSFLSAPAKSQNGMPRRPVVGTAISIQFEMDKATIEEWFGNGYQ